MDGEGPGREGGVEGGRDGRRREYKSATVKRTKERRAASAASRPMATERQLRRVFRSEGTPYTFVPTPLPLIVT